MSATMSLPKTIDGLETIKTLLTTFNIKDVVAAQEELRRQLQLTQAEQGKLAAAKAYIMQHESLEAAMQARESTLTNGNTQLELDKKQHAIHVASENTRLEGFSAKVDARMKQAEDIHAKLEKEKDAFAGLKIDNERQHRDAMAEVQKQKTMNTAVANANAADTQKNTEWAATLKRKAELVRQQMAKFLE